MCELTALEAGLAPLAPQAFLTGMLSLLEAILMRPMQQIADELKLPEMLRAVLVEESPDCDLTHLLAAARSYEHADWHSLIDLAEVLHTPVERLAEAYLSSVRWARSMAVAS
jgi:EAL and modified HD-GYP domain-containing signal transduction protein